MDLHYQEKDFYFNPYLSDGELIEKLTRLSKKQNLSSIDLTDNKTAKFLTNIGNNLEKFRKSRSHFLHHSKGTFALFLYEMAIIDIEAVLDISQNKEMHIVGKRGRLLSERSVLPGKAPVSLEGIEKNDISFLHWIRWSLDRVLF